MNQRPVTKTTFFDRPKLAHHTLQHGATKCCTGINILLSLGKQGRAAVPTKKPRIYLTLEPEEKDSVAKIAKSFGYSESALCVYIIRLFLSQYDGGALPSISENYAKQLKMDL